ncbi:SDR family NAD(P)-dependent oxidoreductase [Rhodococcus oxybenzonivorans]|jgi:NAD(P)-dependent dehydrogenase (short-subunit alcohol dehydrogenase family)|uniref:SDR family NAD(P)-dependent oxidoreductase n=1 Tax=Rhodococcus TaxID=1827 RepID=UPI00131F871E|nr:MULTISPECIES: SDR family NAD(P)-dependent oxidoreductase [Rhodococcus]MDV7356654.1 SDR family NAD(P)-dependent oxidoreductase [Rhodococcus oxybenzonivorans]QHE70822.1 3-hydroxyacyl-CoA dehydrogenase [Rhodococcus sp. WAY2]
MQVKGSVIAVTGGASGLGLATAQRLVDAGAKVALVDLPGSNGDTAAKELGENAIFTPGDVTDEKSFAEALDAADQWGPLKGLVHCAGSGRRLRLLDKEGNPGSLEDFEFVIKLNLVGSFNALRLGAARMAKHEAIDGERGAIIMTASVAAFEGQIGQIPYTASKAGIVGMTLTAARDLASKGIRVCAIAPGIMDTPLLGRLREDVRQSLAASVPNPQRLGTPDEFAHLANHILENAYLNGETIRLDGALRMAPR